MQRLHSKGWPNTVENIRHARAKDEVKTTQNHHTASVSTFSQVAAAEAEEAEAVAVSQASEATRAFREGHLP
jgi:hypothetical protein